MTTARTHFHPALAPARTTGAWWRRRKAEKARQQRVTDFIAQVMIADAELRGYGVRR